MASAEKTTSNLTPTSSSEKAEPAQELDRASLSRRREDRQARTREALAHADEALAFVWELLRQISRAMETWPPEIRSKFSKSVAEGTASILAQLAEGHREHARSLLQVSQNYAQQAAEENDPDRKRRLLALSEKLASDAALTEKEAEKMTQRALAQQENAAAIAASLSNDDTA